MEEVKPKLESVEAKPELAAEPPRYFECTSCPFRVPYEYFGRDVPYTQKFILQEDCYVVEDPFSPSKQGKFIILGSHCIKCGKAVCKDVNCSIYYDGTYCIKCAKLERSNFPVVIRDKLNRIV